MLTGQIHNSHSLVVFTRAALCLLYFLLIILFFRNRHKMSAGGRGWLILTLGLGLDWIGEVLDLITAITRVESRVTGDVKYLFFNAGAFLILGGALFWVRKLTATIDRLSFENIVDPLTRAYNRRYLSRHLGALRPAADLDLKEGRRKGSCVVIIDLDDFKTINDRYGHVYGDLVLKKVVAALHASLRRDDVVIRYGGDEFLVLIDDVTPDDRPSIEARIANALSSVVLPRGEKLSASVGFAFAPSDGTRFDDLLAVADQRMYNAKNRAPGTACSLS